MKKLIYILIIGINFTLFSQEKIINSEIVINNYLKSIGGEEKLNNIITLRKKTKINMKDVPDLNMEAEVVYKYPNLYSSVVKMSKIGQIQSTKYNGKDCVVTRYNNNKKTTSNLEGKLLKEKIKDFLPFPLLELKNQGASLIALQIKNEQGEKINKIYVNEKHKTDSLFFFFDPDEHYLVKKQEISLNSIKTTKYTDYQYFEGIKLPTVEISIIKIDGKIAQQSANRIIEVIINEDIQNSFFE